jgi:sarcosine oxidase subunit alpha
MRVERQLGEVIERDVNLPFSWNGHRLSGLRGDTIASALAASGVVVFSRSFKYHRPRGILTATFHDPNCLVQVGDEPNVRGGHRRLERGMEVRAQNVWPKLELDLASANRVLAPFIGAGFYYKTFMKPERLWPSYEKVLQRFAPGGQVPVRPVSHARYDQRYAHPDVLVAGGGPAGMAAAAAAARAGASVMLVEEEHELGGHLRFGGRAELATLAELRAELAAEPSVEVLCDAVVTGRYDDNWVAVLQRGLSRVRERLVKARTRALVVAPGLIERPYVFRGNDLPGVMLSTAVRRLVNLYAVKPGERAVVLTANEEGSAAAEDLARIGVEVVRVLDARRGDDLVRARGRGRVESVETSHAGTIECDLLVVAAGWTAPTSLLNMAGDRPRYEPTAARFVPGGPLPENVLATGGIVGEGSSEELIAHGRAIGALAAARAGHGRGGEVPALQPRSHPALFRASTHGFVDLSEDVTSKDILAAAREGYDSIELLKRYTTVTMGAEQGKLESVNTVALLAEATGRSIAETGTTTWRPPYVPISLGALAGRPMNPVRCSPMQSWHEAKGAVPIVAGEWIRPEHYGDPAAEVRNVRDHVGIIDVTPLGKLDLRGPDVPKLLSFLYVNRWSRLEVGAVRYGVMCSEDGVVLDDGVTGRLGERHWFTSTTSSGAAAVLEWIELWLQTAHPDWGVHVTAVTSAYASINVAGPRSRELLSRLVSGVDLAPQAFGYMQVRTGSIAGVEGCHMWRIGFTGELSFELHVPAGYGLHVWEQLLEQGKDLHVAPFGLEAQRVMRLEKGHVIVGQDTDATTKAFSAGLDWLVKLDKDDFAGKPELVWENEKGVQARLVGLQPLDPHEVPPEASQIVTSGGAIVGRVTSSRFSPTLGRSICLGVIAPRVAAAGHIVSVQLPDGRRVGATVTEHHAHFDPEGTRLRG